VARNGFGLSNLSVGPGHTNHVIPLDMVSNSITLRHLMAFRGSSLHAKYMARWKPALKVLHLWTEN